MNFGLFIFGPSLLLLAGCLNQPMEDITPRYAQYPVYQKGYRLGSNYVLQQDLFVVKGDRHYYHFNKPGDGVPTVAEWRAGVRKPQFFKVITLLPSGTEVSVEKIIHQVESGSGVSHSTGLLRAAGVDQLISPSFVSDWLSTRSGQLCIPDDRFLRMK
jgi:hypothetical protein